MNLRSVARALAEFISALRGIDTTGGPEPGAHNSGRGVPLAARDAATRKALAACAGDVDSDAATAAWGHALAAPQWPARGVWIHGDLQAGNLLARDGRLVAVIDFGCLGVGDPASDLTVAWNFLDADARATFRKALDADDAMWRRGRGWALSVALIALPYYRDTNPPLAEMARYTIGEVLAESRT